LSNLNKKLQGVIEEEALNFLLTIGTGAGDIIENPDPSWLTEKMWSDICRAAKVIKQ